MKTKKKTLTLAKETLIQLSEPRLSAAEGGRMMDGTLWCTHLEHCWTEPGPAGCI